MRRMEQRILCLWLPNWPMQRVLASEPAIVDRAVVLETRDARRGLLIAAANLAARRAGARVGMRMSELAALTTATDGVLWEVRSYRPEEDLDELCALLEEAYQFSPLVGLEAHDELPWHGRTSCQPQSLLLDVTGIAHLFGGEAALLEQIAAWLRSKRYFGYMCIASTVGAAWALANYEILRRLKQNPESNASKPDASKPDAVAKTSPEYVPESRMLITECWEEAELLSTLPVYALRIDEETISKLRRLGVHSLVQLWQLPRDGLASRLGERLLKRSDQALGSKAEPVLALHAEPEWIFEHTLEHATLSLDALTSVIESLTEQLSKRLVSRGLGVLRCLCRLDLVRQPPLLLNLGLYRPSDDGGHLHRLLTCQLEQVIQRQAAACENESKVYKPNAKQRENHKSGSRKPSPVRSPNDATREIKTEQPLAVDDEGHVWRCTLHATMTGKIVWEQTQLFEASQTRTRNQLANLIDTLSGRLGRGQVLEAKVERDAEPDQSVTYRPLTGRRTDGTPQETMRKLNSRLAGSGAEPRPSDPLRRPTHLLSPPEPLLGASQDSESQLVEFTYENRRRNVLHSWGPERLESGWWRGPSMRRDYYRIETTDGGWWWVYRELTTNQWFLHGVFG